MGITHGMVNHNIGEVVANGMLTIFGHTLKDQGVHALALLNNCGSDSSKDRLAR